MMRSFTVGLGVVGLIFVSSLALAEPEKGKGGEGHGGSSAAAGKGGGEKGEKAGGEKGEKGEKAGGEKGEKGEKAGADGGALKAGAGDDDDDDGPAAADGGKPVAGRRTPAQLTFRKELWERREKALDAKVHKGGKRITAEEREAVQQHWLRIGRLMRIRELAQEDKNDAAVKRVDAAIERAEKGMDAKLEKLSAKTDGGAK
jgi:hypothetical protein